jgi:cell division protein ZapE
MFRRSVPPLLARYDALVLAGAIERDGAQVEALEALARLARTLASNRTARGRAMGFSFAGRALPLFRWRAARTTTATTTRGLYLWGPVGRGKTMLMDLFFETLDLEDKRRAHFHAFMADVHDRLHRARQQGNGASDPVARVAKELAREARVLCFDEFSVADIADATILARLFSALFAYGVVVVATSNVEAARLYEGGRNRDLFLPFVALLQQRMDCVELVARTDFRLEKQRFAETYLTPANKAAGRKIDALFLALTHGARAEPMTLRVKGRRVEIPRATARVARFEFEEICGRPLGASDYAALAARFDTILVENVPSMDLERRNEAKRFITLVDVLYEAKVKLVVSAQSEPQGLYRADHGHEAREFERTVSRLNEMRSGEWVKRG